MSHNVRRHQRTVKGRTVTVRQHRADDPAAIQKKQHALQRKAQRDIATAAAQQLRARQDSEALYPKTSSTRKPRTPGERKRRRSRLKPARAKRHARKALRLWRRHKVKALLFAGLAAGEISLWAVTAAAGKARAAVRKIRKARKTKAKGKGKKR